VSGRHSHLAGRTEDKHGQQVPNSGLGCSGRHSPDSRPILHTDTPTKRRLLEHMSHACSSRPGSHFGCPPLPFYGQPRPDRTQAKFLPTIRL
jgi:hypothetical protein